MSATDRRFLFAHLRAASGGWQALNDRVSALLADWPGARRVGSFMGVFGIGNHELFLLLSLPAATDGAAGLRGRLPADVELVSALPLAATVRPSTDTPLTRAGLYVFRFFDVATSDVDEVVKLSNTAWETFEDDNRYASEPMGLFRPADATAPRGPMLLLTWYDSFNSWELSRSPHPDATANFNRRRALSRSVIAYATRPADPPDPSRISDTGR